MSKNWEARKVNLGGAIIGAAVTLVLGFFVGLNWQNFSNQFLPYLGIGQRHTNNNWSALDEVYDTLVSQYDGELDKNALIEGAKKGLVAAAGDIYTAYMDADESKEYQALLHGEAGSGVGIEMALRDGYVRVIRTLPDNPAGKAGILAGDIIYKIDGEEVYDKGTEVISNKLRGEDGTEVELTVVRGNEEKTFKLTREPINNVSAYVAYHNKTAILTVTRFDTDTGEIVRKIVRDEFSKKGINKVILDLRGNGGGYVSAAQELLSLWIDGQPILIQRGKSGKDETIYANRGGALLANIPTIVLTNGTTASSSEIVAGALKDYGKATIVGETTFGKGVVQTLLNLSGDTLLKVTTARWYTPNGTSINGEGIKPDIEIERTYEDINKDRDPQLDKALSM